jgi:hypothetical protein
MSRTFLSAKKIYGWKGGKDFWLFYGKVTKFIGNLSVFGKIFRPWRCF